VLSENPEIANSLLSTTYQREWFKLADSLTGATDDWKLSCIDVVRKGNYAKV